MIPQRFQADCEYCGMPLDIRKPGIHVFTEGWVENRRGGGAHAIRLPVRHRRFACKWCMDKQASGHSMAQASLF